jgi:hypothetical protein
MVFWLGMTDYNGSRQEGEKEVDSVTQETIQSEL